MAGSVFGFGPRGILPEQQAQDPAQRRLAIDKLATDTQIPANVLLALEEAGEPAEAASSRLGAEIKAGKRVEEVVPAETMSRAYDIADALYPTNKTEEKQKDEPGVVGDMMRQMGGALVSGIGSMGEAFGAAADIYADGGVKLEPETSMAGDAFRAAGGAVRDAGDSIKAGVSEAGKTAMEGSMPDGDLTDPSTWTLGENPSLRGYTMLAADVLGSFLPVVATAVITKNPGASAVVGGAQGGGAAVETARDTVLEMSRTPHPDGGTVLSHESSYYKGLIDAGIPPDEAVRRTSLAAEKMAMLFTTPVSVFGGAATGKLLGPGVDALAGKGLATRAIGTGVASSMEEGLQESAETYATRTGINAGAEANLNPSEGTFGDFILGALGGGVPGAAAGALQEKTGGDGSAPGSAAVPGDGLSPPVGAGPGAAAPDQPLAPTGPISSVAGLAPDLTPVPEPEPPAPKFPDFKPGKEVRLADPETGVIHDAVFLSETPDGVMVRIAGGEFEIDRQEFDASRMAATTADEEAAGKKPKAKKAKVESPTLPPVEPVAAPETGMLDTAAADALKEQGYYDGPWNDQNMPRPGTLDAPKLSEAAKPAPAPKRPKESLDDLSPKEAAKRAKILEDRAAEGGWTRPMREKHQRLKAIAGAQDGATTETDKPVAGKRGAVPARPAGDQPGGSGRDAGLAGAGDGAVAAPSDQRVPVDEVRADGAANDDGALTTHTPFAPITTTPDQRVQPDMLGGADTTEAVMAAKEKSRKEWGRFLAIAEAGKSQDDSMLEGREVLIRGATVRIRAEPGKASDQDIRVDTAGMNRDDIAAAVRGAMNELDRRSPLPPAEADAGAPAAAVRGSAAAGESQPALEKEEIVLPDGKNSWNMAKIIAFRHDDGWRAHTTVDIQGLYGSSGQVKGVFQTKEEAVAAAKEQIAREDVKNIAATRPDGTTSSTHIAKAKKILKWAGVEEANPSTKPVVADKPAKPEQKPALGLLSALSQDKQARAADLQKRLADKMRNQVSSGLDPEYITLGGELVKLYIEAGAKRFGQMLADFAETTGLTLKQAQEPLRAAYNHVRDNMELEGEDVSGMDDARAVLEEARKAIQGEASKPTEATEPVAEKAPQPAGTGREPPRPEEIPALIRWGVTGPQTSGGGKFRDDVAYGFIEANDPDARKVNDQKAVDLPAPEGVAPPLSVGPAPTPETAPWWDSADDLTRRAVMDAAELSPQASMARPFADMPERVRKALTDAFGRLYRDKKVENIGTTEAPRYALTGTTIEGTAVEVNAVQGKSDLPKGSAPGEPAAADVARAKSAVIDALKLARERNDETAIAKFGIDMRSTISQRMADDALGYVLTNSGVQIENIREKAAVLRGLPKDRPPQVPNISLKWDDTEGGFVFSRKHADAVLQAAFVEEDKIAAEAKAAAAKPAPTATEVKAAAAETDPNPTPAQAEAENYKTGKTNWRGLTLSIENAKGSIRRKVTPDGKTEWQVTMPAHYGRILGTTGADGDHVDFYMGGMPESEAVFVVDQRDADTGRFDEIKVMLGFRNANGAFRAYTKGFSDGRGEERAEAISATTVDGIKEFLQSRDATGSFAGTKGTAWTVPSPTLQGLAERAGSLPKPSQPALPQLRGPGDNGASQADELPAVLGRRGREADATAPAGPGGQRSGVSAGQSSVADEEGTGAQYAEEPSSDRVRRDKDADGMGGQDEPGSINDPLQAGSRDERGGRGADASQDQRPVLSRPPAAVDRLIEGTVDLEPDGSEAVDEITVAREGPWDFTTVYPSPDPVQVGRLEVEGRSPFDANTPEEVVSILDETMFAAVDQRATANRWSREIQTIEDGGKPTFTVPKGRDPLEEAEKNFRTASQAFDDTIGAIQDVWGEAGAKAFRKEASDRAAQSQRENPPADTKAPPIPTPSTGLVSPDSQDVEKPAIMAPAATGKTRNEQRRNQRRDQGQPDLFAWTGNGMDGAGRSEAERDRDGRGEGDEEPAGSQPGSEPAGSLVGDQGRLPDREGVAPPNFTIPADFALGSGTDGQKLEANLAALRLVKTLDAENRYATAEEQAVLARWVGWGGLKTLFDEKHNGTTNQWGRAQAELKSLLSKTEYYDAMRSTNDAHYTSRTVVGAMWEAMRNFGFTGGRALEPTIGSGNFLGLQPADLSAQTDWFASELDPVTGRIAKHLYPRATVFDGMGFQDAPFRPATFDIAIGNPPFGGDNSRVGNKKMHPDLGRMKVHNFVIAKTGQLLREGGIMGMVVTHRFLDAMDAEARDILAPGFHFLGAVRLPNTAFKANAGTEVTTDIVFFQKRRAGDEQGDTSWMGTGAAGPNGTRMNAWFANNPDMILGRPAMDGTMYAGGRRGEGEFTVHDDGRDLGKALTEAMAKIKASLPDREAQLEDAVTAPKTVSTLAYGEMVLTADGKIFRGEQDGARNPVIEEITRETFWKANAAGQFDLVQALRPFAEADLGDSTIEQRQRVRDAAVAAGLLDLAGDPVTKSAQFEQALADAIPALLYGRPTQAHRDAFAEYAKRVEAKRLGTNGFDRLKAILDLRGRTLALIRAERNDDPAMEQIRGGLRTAYGEFTAKYGFLNNPQNEAILQGQVGAEMALEIHYKPAKDGRKESATVAPIQTKRVIFPHKLPERMDSVADAVHVSMQEKGYVDPGLIAQLTDKTGEEVIAELTGGERPMAFKNPATSRFELAESYLSGNLAEKIEKATAARAYEHIPHLKAAMPPPKTQDQITPSIRSMWIPRQVFEDFLRAMGYPNPVVLIAEKVGMAAVEAGSAVESEYGGQFSTKRMSAAKIFENALKGKIPVIYDTIRTADGDKRVKNEDDTKDAVAAYERMTAEFPNWAYANPMRANLIVDAFNEKVNVVTPRKYEGTRYLRTVGTSPLVELRNSQKNGAWRMIQDKTVLLHHVVGAGKTMTGITGIMERRRMGLTRKAVVVVPNHLTGQWGREWLELYPAANILVPTEKDFEPANRSKLINRIATGDFDAVIIGHSQLVKIDNDEAAVAKYVGDEMDALNDAMQAAKASGDSKRTVGQMGNKIKKLKEKLDKLNDALEERRGAGLLPWHELGVDYLLLDESQEFKNLEYATSATQLVGMNDPDGSQKAFDLLMKLRSLQAMPNAGIAFMTGTPISNSLVEIYSVMKYLIPESMDAMGIKHFDAWKAAFIQDQSRFEYTASMQLKERNVMSGMVNLGPLAELYRSFADIVMRPDVERMYREQMETKNAANPGGEQVSTRFPTPKIKGGKRRIMLAPPTDRMVEFTRYLVMRMGGIAGAGNKKEYAKIDNPLWVLTDARKASVDIRTIDPSAQREEGAKVSRAGAEVFRIWEANKDRRGAQMVFSDMSVPLKSARASASAMLKKGYGKIGLKKDALKRRVAADEGKSFSARWADLVGEIEEIMASPATSDAERDSLAEWIDSEDVRDAAAAMATTDSGFSFYDDLRALLIEKGIPAGEIAFIHDYDTTAKKKDLFEAVNEGKIRVLIGSTVKMGAGTNAQRRLVALHHIDAPWRPSDMEQREGRIIRQGNLFYEQDPDGFEVEIIAYSTEKTADVVQWQVLERKAKAIETFLGAAADSLIEEGGDADQYAEFMAQSTGKKVFLDKMAIEKEIIRARGAIANALRSRSEAKSFIGNYQDVVVQIQNRIAIYGNLNMDALPAGADQYMADWRGKIEAYKIARDKAEAEAEEVRKYNVGRERKEWKKLPEQPNAPKRWAERPTNAYDGMVYDALEAAEARLDDAQVIPLQRGYKIEVTATAAGEGGLKRYDVHLVPPVSTRHAIALTEWTGTTAKNFRNSEKILAAFDPNYIVQRATTFREGAERDLQRHVAMKPKMEEVLAKPVDEERVNQLAARLAELTAEARIEEVKYAEETAKAGPNRFAMLDDKGRSLSTDGMTKPLTGQFQFQNAGRTYASTWGAPAGRKRIEGTDKFGEMAYFEANDMDTDAAVIVQATQPPKEEGGAEKPWQVERVFARTGDGVKEMREDITPYIDQDKPVDDLALRVLTKDLNADLAAHGLTGKITVRAVRKVATASGITFPNASGLYQNGGIQISARAESTKGTMRHEIIHALRDSAAWDRPYGLFFEREWLALERAAYADRGIRQSVLERYPDLDPEMQREEMVAELYRLWADGRDESGTVGKALERIMQFFEAMANLLRGRGFISAAGVMEQIARGSIGGAAPTPPGGGRRTLNGSKESDAAEMRAGGLLPSGARRKFKDLLGSAHWKNPEAFFSNALTDSMAGKNGINTLALVPGRALFSELGKRIMSAKTYLRAKEEMDALRNDWHSRADAVAQVWRKARAKDPRANDDLMDLMHRSTLSGIDPSKPDTWKHAFAMSAEREVSKHGDKAPKWALSVMDQIEKRKTTYASLKVRYDALPEDMKAIYRRVRAEYDKLGDDFEKAVLENIQAGLKVALKRAQKAYRKEIQRIKDDGLHDEEKAQAMLKAQAALDAVKARGGYGAKAKIAALRKQFESNRLKGPYFPLARFGQFFVTIRNERGEVTSFSRFEKESQQQTFIREQKQAGEANIQFGVLSDAGKLREQVDPSFVADVESMLADAGASNDVMDAIWQRWLETLPDTSIRTAKIHRKGREGWNKDAFRAFGSHMFHGAHQLARLKYGLELDEALNDAEDEARVAEDPNRAGLIVNEMRRRHDFTMNPQGSSIVAGMSSLAFVWYLGATPAAALANVSQTTVMGPGIMAARFQKAGFTSALREIGRAMADFTKGRGNIQKAPGITQDEHAALTEAYRRGTIDRTQAHDLASVAETGIEYNATRENIMRKIGFFFHHAERMNREVTFLAAYRMARAEGLRGDDAIDAAADTTWKIHFDYQNTSRPRFMQNDMGKILTVFRNYTVNLNYRMFRDMHQAMKGATKEDRAEARKQLIGVSLSMMAHAGIKGAYGYGIIMLLLSMFFPGDSDDLEEWLQDALLMEGDSMGVAAWNYIMGAALNGVPGQILGADLTDRIGAPNIWFRGASSDLEGEDLVMHYVTELLGPPLGIALGLGRGIQHVSDGEVYRGVETAVPKVVRDIMKAGRYGMEGVETMGGDDILPDVNPYQLLLQASGFTPAEVAERFDMNSRLKNKEREIMDERKDIHKAAADALLAGEDLPASVLEDIRDFNTRFPEYPITAKTIRQSAQGRQRAHQNAEAGVSLNKRLAARLRDGLAEPVYN